MAEERITDVAIIGAGIAGLRLADRLVHENRSSVIVVEANDRIGGRMLSQEVAETTKGTARTENSTGNALVVDGGAQFVGGTHTRLLELVDELGLKKFPAAPIKGGKFRWAQEIGPWFRFGLSPDVSEPQSFEAVRTTTEELAATIPLDAPWTATNASELDSQTFGSWLHKNFSKSACVPYERLCKMHLGCDPNAISLLYALFLLHSCGGYNRIVKHEDGGAHQWRIEGGSWQICQRLAERIGSEKILLGSPVREIRHDLDDGVEIFCDNGFKVKAGRVAIALQPQLCKHIAFNPPLNSDRTALHEQYLTKRPFTAKTHLIYNSPFWRDHGYSGTGVTSTGVVFVDNSLPTGTDKDAQDTEKVGILLAFRDTRRSDLTHDKLKKYAKTLFGKEGGNPIAIVEQDWSAEHYTASCISHTPPGLLSKHGQALREPSGRIHWAGAETSAEWPSFMEGAVCSADRVYQELIQEK